MASDDDAPDAPNFSEDRPLDALFPELRGRGGPGGERLTGASSSPVHPGVVTVELEHGREWLLIAWRDPGGAGELRRAVGQLVEASLLWALTRPSEGAREDLRALELFVFAPVEALARPMLTLGFRPVPYVVDAYRGRMTAVRELAEASGMTAPSAPDSVWRAEIARPDGALVERMEAIETRMAAALEGERWGEEPGHPSKVLADAVGEVFGVVVTPDLDGLEQLDVLLVERREAAVRWMPPLVFLGLCDFVGVVLQAMGRARVQWAVADAAGGGMPQPPMLRVRARGRALDVPIARRMANWVVLPLLPGVSASLRERFEGEFAGL